MLPDPVRSLVVHGASVGRFNQTMALKRFPCLRIAPKRLGLNSATRVSACDPWPFQLDYVGRIVLELACMNLELQYEATTNARRAYRQSLLYRHTTAYKASLTSLRSTCASAGWSLTFLVPV